mmetsp:Transcript_57997/g.136707  ORF Transcript_57997/g.136707 Transcript_57997/m.136707 type:complete len:238 (+) Transcript_57997:409-1122(+)
MVVLTVASVLYEITVYACRLRPSERVDALLAAVVDIADARTRAQADTESDRGQRDAIEALVVDAGAADVVKAAVDAWEALVDRADLRQAVDQREHFGGVGAEIKADGGPRPIDAGRASGLGDQFTVAIAQADGDGRAGFLALDVGIGAPLLLEGLFDDLGQALGGLSEEVGGCFQDGILVIGSSLVVRGGGRQCRGGGEGSEVLQVLAAVDHELHSLNGQHKQSHVNFGRPLRLHTT